VVVPVFIRKFCAIDYDGGTYHINAGFIKICPNLAPVYFRPTPHLRRHSKYFVGSAVTGTNPNPTQIFNRTESSKSFVDVGDADV